LPLPDEEEDRKKEAAIPGLPDKMYTAVGMQPPTYRWRELPLNALAIGGGLYGGYKLTDFLVDKLRQAALDRKLRNVKSDYEKTLIRMYDREPKEQSGSEKEASATFSTAMRRALVSEKNAADQTQGWQFGQAQSSLGKKLDDLYDLCFVDSPDGVKQAAAGAMDNLLVVLGLSAL